MHETVRLARDRFYQIGTTMSDCVEDAEKYSVPILLFLFAVALALIAWLVRWAHHRVSRFGTSVLLWDARHLVASLSVPSLDSQSTCQKREKAEVVLCLHGLIGGWRKASRLAASTCAKQHLARLGHESIWKRIVQANRNSGHNLRVYLHSWNPELASDLDTMYQPVASSHEHLIHRSSHRWLRLSAVRSQMTSMKRVLLLMLMHERSIFWRSSAGSSCSPAWVIVSRFDLLFYADLDISRLANGDLWLPHWCGQVPRHELQQHEQRRLIQACGGGGGDGGGGGGGDGGGGGSGDGGGGGGGESSRCTSCVATSRRHRGHTGLHTAEDGIDLGELPDLYTTPFGFMSSRQTPNSSLLPHAWVCDWLFVASLAVAWSFTAIEDEHSNYQRAMFAEGWSNRDYLFAHHFWGHHIRRRLVPHGVRVRYSLSVLTDVRMARDYSMPGRCAVKVGPAAASVLNGTMHRLARTRYPWLHQRYGAALSLAQVQSEPTLGLGEHCPNEYLSGERVWCSLRSASCQAQAPPALLAAYKETRRVGCEHHHLALRCDNKLPDSIRLFCNSS